MKLVLGIISLFCFGISSAMAYELAVTETDRPYEVVPTRWSSEVAQVYLGELLSYPVMYELTATEPFTLSTQVQQLYKPGQEPRNFSLMVVRQNDGNGGVTEVTRVTPTTEEWAVVKDAVLGMTFWESNRVAEAVGPGTYRIEVSTPQNTGKYRLHIGATDKSAGYFETLGQVRTTQDFFDQPFFRLLASSYVYYTIGVIGLLFIGYRIWKYRKTVTYAE